MILYFRDEYEFLSNYYDPCPVTYNGLTYRNSEAAYQAQKSDSAIIRFLFTDMSPDEAKRLGKSTDIIADWDSKKAGIMREIVHAKFEQHPELVTRLMMIEDEILVEGNNWHDNYFGDCRCPKCKEIPGRNWLGRILMEEREFWQRQTESYTEEKGD